MKPITKTALLERPKQVSIFSVNFLNSLHMESSR